MASSVVLEEEYDENYEPTQEEVIEYAKFLGMDPVVDKHLLWIARDSLKAPLPADWKPCQTDDGNIYYFNFKTGASIWDHPCDEDFRNLYQTEKAKSKENGSVATNNAVNPNTLKTNPSKQTTVTTSKSASISLGTDSKPKLGKIHKKPHTENTLGTLSESEHSEDNDVKRTPSKSIPLVKNNQSALTQISSNVTMASIAAGSNQTQSKTVNSGLVSLKESRALPSKPNYEEFDDEDFSDIDDLLPTEKLPRKPSSLSKSGMMTKSNVNPTNDLPSNPTLAMSAQASKTLHVTSNSNLALSKPEAGQTISSFQDTFISKSNSKPSLKKQISFDDDFDLSSDSHDDKQKYTEKNSSKPMESLDITSKNTALKKIDVSNALNGLKSAPTPSNTDASKPTTTLAAPSSAIETTLVKPGYLKEKPAALDSTFSALKPLSTNLTGASGKISQLRSLDDFDDSDESAKSELRLTSLDVASVNPVQKTNESIKVLGSNSSKVDNTCISSLGNERLASMSTIPTSHLPTLLQSNFSKPATVQLGTLAAPSFEPPEAKLSTQVSTLDTAKLDNLKELEERRFQQEKESLLKAYQSKLATWKAEQDKEFLSSQEKLKHDMLKEIDAIRQEAKGKIDAEIAYIQSFTLDALVDSKLKHEIDFSSHEKLDTFDSVVSAKCAEFKKGLAKKCDELNQEARKKESELLAKISEEHQKQLELSSKKMTQESRLQNDKAIEKLKLSLDMESDAQLIEARKSIQAAEEEYRKQSQARIDALQEKTRAQEAEAKAEERKIGEIYESMKTEWKKKLANLEQEMTDAEFSVKDKQSMKTAQTQQIAQMRQDTEQAIEEERRLRKLVDMQLEQITIKERELKQLQLDTEQAARDEKDRRRRIDGILDELAFQEQKARDRLQATLSDMARQETTAQTQNNTILNDNLKLEYEIKLKQTQLEQNREALHRELKDIEQKRSQLKDESRQYELQASQKRQAAIELGPLEREIDLRRQELVSDRTKVEGLMNEVNTQRQKLEDEKFRLTLTEKEVLLLRKQLEEEKQILEHAQSDLLTERRRISSLRAGSIIGDIHDHAPNHFNASAYTPKNKQFDLDAHSNFDRMPENSLLKHKRTHRTKARDSHTTDELTDTISKSSQDKSELSQCTSQSSHLTSDVATVNDSLAQLKARIRQEECELKDAKRLLKSQHIGIENRVRQMVSHEMHEPPLPISELNTTASTSRPLMAMDLQPHMETPKSPALKTPSISAHAVLTEASLANSETCRVAPSLLLNRNGSLDQIEGELNKLLSVLKEQHTQTGLQSTKNAYSINQTFEHYTPSIPTSGLTEGERLIRASTQLGRIQREPISSAITRDKYIQDKALLSSALNRSALGGKITSAYHKTEWDAGNLHTEALLSEHGEWLKQFRARISK
ncbi:hypothetical protein MT418_000631 [Batrachochytrium dendrobatidis]